MARAEGCYREALEAPCKHQSLLVLAKVGDRQFWRCDACGPLVEIELSWEIVVTPQIWWRSGGDLAKRGKAA